MSDWEQRAEAAGGSKLNPGAKSFSFNPNARSFVPGGAPAPAPAPSTEGTWLLCRLPGCGPDWLASLATDAVVVRCDGAHITVWHVLVDNPAIPVPMDDG